MHLTIVVNPRVWCERSRESIDTSVTFAASAIFASEMILFVGYVLSDLCLQRQIVSGKSSTDNLINLMKG